MAEYLYLRVSEETKKLLRKVSTEATPRQHMNPVAERFILEGIERELNRYAQGDDRVQRMIGKVRAL